jgi:outer membrane protein
MKDMKKIKGISVGAILVLGAFSGIAAAQALKMGYVDVGRLISESPQAATAMEALQVEFAPRQREIIAMQNEYKEKEAQIERDREVMGLEERNNAERDRRNAERNLARSQQEFTEDLNLRRNEELGKLQRELLRQVQVFAGDEGYDLVVSSDVVLYASQTIDVTEEVLTGLKASFGSAPSGN